MRNHVNDGIAARRMAADHRARGSLIRLLCVASFLRVGLTRLLPLAGSAAWWTALVCLLPGAAVLGMLRLMLHWTGVSTLAEGVRACLGKRGAWAASWLIGACLLLGALSALTALLTMFTEGVGTRGTQFTLAVLTAMVLVACLHREGLSRAAVLLRWPLTALAVLLLIFALPEMHLDGLYPLGGTGGAATLDALKSGWSLGWPLALLLTVPPVPGQRRLATAVVPCIWCAGTLLALTLLLPHEVLLRHAGLADGLLLPGWYLPNALRTLAQCGMMLLIFLGLGGMLQAAAAQLCVSWGRVPGWLPSLLAALLTLTQLGDTSELQRWLSQLESWLLTIPAALALICLPVAWGRRKS